MLENEFFDDISKYNQMLRVAKMYYELDISQEEISVLENTSKATVSRILQKAKSMGIITFSINYPVESVNTLEEKIKQKFNIRSCFVAPAYVDDYNLILKDVCKALATDLARIVKENDVIGISWGRTMDALSSNLVNVNNVPELKIVQLNGNVATNINSARFSSILVKFAYMFNATAYQLPAPLMLDNEKIKAALLTDSQIKKVMDLGKLARIVVFSVGRLSKESVLFEAGSIKENMLEELKQKNTVGDICGHYIDAHGNIADTDLEKKTLGLSLEELLKKEYRITITVGKEKVPALAGALQGGFITDLYIDEISARELINWNP